jgi:hypothetical protein
MSVCQTGQKPLRESKCILEETLPHLTDLEQRNELVEGFPLKMSLEWEKRPGVFDSFSPIGGKLIRRSAINWRKIQAVDHGLLPALHSAWTGCKSELGYAT